MMPHRQAETHSDCGEVTVAVFLPFHTLSVPECLVTETPLQQEIQAETHFPEDVSRHSAEPRLSALKPLPQRRTATLRHLVEYLRAAVFLLVCSCCGSEASNSSCRPTPAGRALWRHGGT